MILILSPNITPRHTYIINFLKEQLGVEITIISDIKRCKDKDGIVINYSSIPLPDSLQIIPMGLLDELNITDQTISVEWQNNVPWFFRTQKSGDMPYDIFSAMFFMLTRYEELLTDEKDVHQRFQAKSSLAYKEKFITRPVVELWIEALKRIIGKNHEITFASKKYKFLPTVDIDSVYAYKHKSILLQGGAMARHIIRKEWKQAFDQIKVHLGILTDPFDTFVMLQKSFAKKNVEPHLFLQVGDRDIYDKNIDYNNLATRKIVKKMQNYAKVGLHTSYHGAFSQTIIKEESLRLQEITTRPTNANRFHYLRMQLPDSYISLVNNNINEDYTMGFADHVGYRAGISTPYTWFDARTNRETTLRVIPFVAMDGTMRKYMQCTPFEAITLLKPIIAEVKQLNGQFCFLWHNSSFTSAEGWSGWDDVFQWIIKNG